MSDAKPIRCFGLLPGNRKLLNLTNLACLHLPSSVGVVVAVKFEAGGMRRLTLEEAEKQGYLTIIRQRDNHFGAVSDISIQIKSARVHLAVYPKP